MIPGIYNLPSHLPSSPTSPIQNLLTDGGGGCWSEVPKICSCFLIWCVMRLLHRTSKMTLFRKCILIRNFKAILYFEQKKKRKNNDIRIIFIGMTPRMIVSLFLIVVWKRRLSSYKSSLNSLSAFGLNLKSVPTILYWLVIVGMTPGIMYT